MKMIFRFQPLKTIQAAAFVVDRYGGEMYGEKLAHILYLADRQELLEKGSPLTGDLMANRSIGPVLETVYECILLPRDAPSPLACPQWAAYLRRATEPSLNTFIEIKKDPGNSELSVFDTDVLTAISNTCVGLSPRHMARKMWRLPEWKDPSPNDAVRLEYQDVLKAGGVSPSTIAAYERLNEGIQSVAAIAVTL